MGSGPGSFVKNSQGATSALLNVIEQRGISSMIDVGCGDCNWISKLDFFSKPGFYIGVDLASSVIEDDRRKFEGIRFEYLDLATQDLPARRSDTELLFCRQTMNHM